MNSKSARSSTGFKRMNKQIMDHLINSSEYFINGKYSWMDSSMAGKIDRNKTTISRNV